MRLLYCDVRQGRARAWLNREYLKGDIGTATKYANTGNIREVKVRHTHTHIIIAKSRGDMSLVTLWRASTKYANKGEAGMVKV